jgi:hypothetical protein
MKHKFYSGTVIWEPPVIYNFLCEINIEWFPYDEQFCSMKFGSWTYYGSQLDMIQVQKRICQIKLNKFFLAI